MAIRLIGASVVALAVGLWVLPAAAQYDYGTPPASPTPAAGSQADRAERQLRTAIQHSKELAAGAAALSGIQTHLQHVVNCLEGSGGRNFKAAAGHPCQGMGNGFLNDARDKPGAVLLARHANELAVDLVTGRIDVATGQAGARAVAATLEEAMKLLR